MFTSERLLASLLLIALLPVYGMPIATSPLAAYRIVPSSQSAPAYAATRPFRVGVQVGRYKNNELPPQLARLVGHTGAYGGGRSELSLNLDVAGRVARLLRASGVTVDTLPATVPTGYSADAFVAIHADGADSSSAHGFKISTRWSSSIALQDAMLVEMLTDAYRAATGLAEDGNVTRNMRGYYAFSPWRPNYRVSNYTPSAIVEMGYMTSPADRAVLFNATDKVASGIANGVTMFLKSAYPQPSGTRGYGYDIIDNEIDPRANPTPMPTPRPNAPPIIAHGNWQVLLMGKPTINIYSQRGGGTVVASLPRNQLYHSLLRYGNYYDIVLPDGKEGWVHRNAVIVQR
jgi:hypothetical protein